MGTPSAAYMRDYRAKNPERIAEQRRRYRQKVKRECIDAYGGKCSCCGESEIAFLTIDHTDGSGGLERKERGHRGGIRQYLDLRKAGYPPGYRVLCWNCNLATHHLGPCPHEGAES